MPNRMTNVVPPRSMARRMRRWRASYSVRRAMVRIPFTWSSGALVLAHDFQEGGLERRAARVEPVEVRALLDEPPRDFGDRFLVLHAQPDGAVVQGRRAGQA